MGNKQIRSGILLTYLTGVSQIAANLIMTAALVRSLGDVEYGLYLLLGSLAAYVSVFDFGLNNTISIYVAKYRAAGDKKKESNLLFIVFSAYCLISVIIILVGLFVRGNLGLFISGISSEYMSLAQNLFMLLIINIAVSLPMNSFSAILAGYELFTVSRSVSLVRVLAMPVFSILLLYLGGGSTAVVLVTTVTNILAGLLNAFWAHRKCKIKIKLYYFDKGLAKEIFGYSIFVFLGVMADQIFYNTGNVVLGMVRGPVEVRAFGVSIQLTQYLVAIAAAFTGVYLSRATALVMKTREKKELTSFFSGISTVLSVILFYIMGGYVLLGQEFIHFWLGAELGNVFLLSIMVMIPTVWMLTRAMGLSIMQAMNKHRFRSVVFLVRAVVNALACYFLAQSMGELGVSISYMVCLVICNVIIDIYFEKKVHVGVMGFTVKTLPVLLSAAVSVVLIGLSYWAVGYSVMAMLIRGIAYTVLFFAGVYRFFLDSETRQKLLGRLRPRLKHAAYSKKEQTVTSFTVSYKIPRHCA